MKYLKPRELPQKKKWKPRNSVNFWEDGHVEIRIVKDKKCFVNYKLDFFMLFELKMSKNRSVIKKK